MTVWTVGHNPCCLGFIRKVQNRETEGKLHAYGNQICQSETVLLDFYRRKINFLNWSLNFSLFQLFIKETRWLQIYRSVSENDCLAAPEIQHKMSMKEEATEGSDKVALLFPCAAVREQYFSTVFLQKLRRETNVRCYIHLLLFPLDDVLCQRVGVDNWHRVRSDFSYFSFLMEHIFCWTGIKLHDSCFGSAVKRLTLTRKTSEFDSGNKFSLS